MARQKNGKTFSLWSVEDKAAFYERLLEEIDTAGVSNDAYPKYAREVLRNVHGLPSPGHITEEETRQFAFAALKNNGIDAFPFVMEEAIGVFFLEDQAPVYVVRFYNGEGFDDFQYAVEVDPTTGEAKVIRE